MFLDYWSIDSGSRNLFCGILAIHDIPCEVAVHRHQSGAIHVAGSVSLLMLHVFLAVSLDLDARGKLELAKFQLCAKMFGEAQYPSRFPLGARLALSDWRTA